MSVFAQLFVYQLNKKDLEVLLNLGESQAHCLADSHHNTSGQILLFSEFSHLHLQLHYLLIPVPLFSVCCNRMCFSISREIEKHLNKCKNK